MIQPQVIILTALAAELDVARIPDGASVLFTGVGKVNAAIATMQTLQRIQPALVINYGTAGKTDGRLHGLVEVAQVIQRDMNAEPLSPRGADAADGRTTPLLIQSSGRDLRHRRQFRHRH